jgi:hypothetical protein
MSMSVSASPSVLSPLQSLLQPDTAGDAASPSNPVAGLFQSASGVGAMLDPSAFATSVATAQTGSGGSPLDPSTIGTLFTLQSNAGKDGTVQSTSVGAQDGQNAESPVDQTDPRHLPVANPTHARRHHHTRAIGGVPQDSGSFAQNATDSPVSTAADSADPAGSATTNVAANQNILLEQLIQLQKQLVTVANPILSTII